MNNNIKRLIDDATTIEHGVDNGFDRVTFDKEKFAELLINKCTDIVNKRKDAAIDASWNVDEAMSNAVWDIESHFYGAQE